MTDPVNTDVLRAWAVDARDIAANGGSGPNLLSVCAENLVTAADEVDRLRTDLNEVATAAGFELDARDAELARLRATVKSAPHAYECFADFTPGSECTCWKADVL